MPTSDGVEGSVLALNLALYVPEIGAPSCGCCGLRPNEVTPSFPYFVGPPSFRV